MTSDKQIPTIFSLTALGLVFVFSLAFFSFVFDRMMKDDQAQVVVQPEEEVVYAYEAKGYGIRVVDLENWRVEVEEELEADMATLIDCRKMSASMRESLIAEGSECFEVMFLTEDLGKYVTVTTGTSYHYDSDRKYILEAEDSLVREYPDSNVNLPLERIYVSNFPVNFNGVRVVYASGVSFTYYEGIVYKGADKYAILVKGELDDDVKSLLDQLELE